MDKHGCPLPEITNSFQRRLLHGQNRHAVGGTAKGVETPEVKNTVFI